MFKWRVFSFTGGSKLLEKIVCEQTTKYMEENNLLPDNQHGFRAKRSTMTAWANIQQEWAQNTENKQMTGIMQESLNFNFMQFSTNHYKSLA